MIYFFQKLWLIVITMVSLVGITVTQILSLFIDPTYWLMWRAWVGMTTASYLRRSSELLVFKEYRKARWATAGSNVLSLQEYFIKHNGIYGKTILWAYAILCVLIGVFSTILVSLASNLFKLVQ
jgi:hypothetical protein